MGAGELAGVGGGGWHEEAADKTQALHSQSGSQGMRWDPLSSVGSHVISCETASRGMLSQIRDRRAPAFSTHARSWLFTQTVGRCFLRIDSRTKRRQCLLEYTKF